MVERFRRLLYRDRAVVADVVHRESGKPLPEAIVADVAMALEGARFITRIAEDTLATRRVLSQTMAAYRKVVVTHYDPYGVVAVVSPWNYPFFFPAMPVLFALVSGNAVVIKPSEHTPQCVDHLARLLHEAGVPPDVLTVLHGDGRMGAALVNADIDKVFFTGSERTGRAIAVSCAPRFVPVSLELGSSDAAIVREDADLALTASGVLWGRFANAGQTCVACKRVIAVGKSYDALVPLLSRGVAQLSVGAVTTNGVEAPHDIGPMISAPQRALIAEQLADAVAQGATVVAERAPTSGSDAADRVAPAVLLTNVTPQMRVWHEETFGPLLVVARATSDDDAIRLANDTRYGLSASVWTTDRKAGAAMAARIEAGAVTINDALISAGLPEVAHGGNKASGLGRAHSVEGLLETVRTRTVVDDRLTRARQPWWFGYGPNVSARLDAYLRLSHGQSLFERLSGVAGTLRLLLRPEQPL